MRKRVASAGLLVVVSAWFLAGWAGVNGPNYHGWSHAFVAFAFVALACVAVALVRMPSPGARRISLAAGAYAEDALRSICARGGASAHGRMSLWGGPVQRSR
jgi:hypothetical protein